MMVFENIVNTHMYFSEFGEPSDRICQTQEASMELWLAESPSEIYGGQCLQLTEFPQPVGPGTVCRQAESEGKRVVVYHVGVRVHSKAFC